MNNGNKITFNAGTRRIGTHEMYTIEYTKDHHFRRIEFGDETMRDYVLELLNNPPDPFKKPELDKFSGSFVVQGKAFNITGTREAVEIVTELANFFTEATKPGEFKPYRSPGQKSLEDRVAELEKMVFVLSSQPASTQEHARRQKALEEWNSSLPPFGGTDRRV